MTSEPAAPGAPGAAGTRGTSRWPPARAPQAVFPLMVPAAADFSAYEGFATVRGGGGGAGDPPRQLPLRIEGLPPRLLTPSAHAHAHAPSLGSAASGAAAAAGAAAGKGALRGARLRLGAELKALLGTYEAVMQARLEAAPDLASFFEEIRDAVSQALVAADKPRPARPPGYYLQLLDHLGALPQGTVGMVSDDAGSVTLSVRDRSGRVHALSVTVPADYPASAPTVSADLPVQLELKQWGQGSSMRDVVSAALDAADSLAWLWDQLEELDRGAYVIEPAERPPPRAAASRTLALGGHVTLVVSLDLRGGPAQPPRVQLLGAEAAVAEKRKAITAALQGWGPASHLLPTLVGCLGALPGPAGTGGAAGGGGGASAEDAAADVQAECVICYAYRYPGEARWFKPPTRMCFASALPPLPFDSDMTHADKGPDEGCAPQVPCENPKCARQYHRTCLADWLRGAASTTKVFNTLFGACAYCEVRTSPRGAAEPRPLRPSGIDGWQVALFC